MTRDDVLAYVNRDWASIERLKSRSWKRLKRSPADDLAAADQLRQHTLRIRSDWPGASDRAADLEAHQRVGKALRAITVRSR